MSPADRLGLALAILGGAAVLVMLAGVALALWDTRRRKPPP
jgi:hypothetical protein